MKSTSPKSMEMPKKIRPAVGDDFEDLKRIVKKRNNPKSPKAKTQKEASLGQPDLRAYAEGFIKECTEHGITSCDDIAKLFNVSVRC